ncbi:hypothetical protein BFJ66_g999 [Fusarium oxysporum f. sp. cepae]|uniref:Uncharacterized protein n=1 Tax=Fusarium oxysporum f. sp. cepae TaxID=396571 RepID=A0A3L6NJ29_FUSOX|nr:hypothetical protein BFJ65_g8376 [Fusarium oxysporum f. sp. cepae]RKK34475.1 hypothetical protein BFJ67_g13753 [Fusarium oxysporum f. sp. cepae]RKK62191.1 hypothetical protein BFJ66_g999 [Fusarium oxysporum f. sp. cepae]
MDKVTSLKSIDLSALSREELSTCMGLCKEASFIFQARSLLHEALQPKSIYDNVSLGRLTRLLEHVFGGKPSRRASALRNLELIPFIVIGLSIPLKNLDRMEQGLFDAVLRQADEAVPRVGTSLLKEQISKIIYESKAEDLKANLNLLYQDVQTSNHLLFRDRECWHFVIGKNAFFKELISLSMTRTVTVYINKHIPMKTGAIRITVAFDADLLQNLFAFHMGKHNVEKAIELPSAVKSQIIPSLGSDTFNAIQSTERWMAEESEPTTTCDKSGA